MVRPKFGFVGLEEIVTSIVVVGIVLEWDKIEMETIYVEDSTTKDDIEKRDTIVVEIDKVEYFKNYYYSSILVAKDD